MCILSHNIGPTVEPQAQSGLEEAVAWCQIGAHVFADFEVLHSYALPIDQLLYQEVPEAANCIGRTFLLRIHLEYYTAVHGWSVTSCFDG